MWSTSQWGAVTSQAVSALRRRPRQVLAPDVVAVDRPGVGPIGLEELTLDAAELVADDRPRDRVGHAVDRHAALERLGDVQPPALVGIGGGVLGAVGIDHVLPPPARRHELTEGQGGGVVGQQRLGLGEPVTDDLAACTGELGQDRHVLVVDLARGQRRRGGRHPPEPLRPTHLGAARPLRGATPALDPGPRGTAIRRAPTAAGRRTRR